MPLLNDEAEKGWSAFINDVHSFIRRKPKDDLPKPPVIPSLPQSDDRRSYRNILLISIITAIGLSIGYWLFDFVLGFL